MRLPSFRSAGSITLALLATLDVAYGVYDVSQPKDPKGPLKVALDYTLATSWPEPKDQNFKGPRPWTWSSHIIFKDAVDKGITDGQLWQIGRDAVDEMKVDREQYGIGDRAEPTAMGVLAWGSEIIISSSVKGAGAFSYDFKPVKDGLTDIDGDDTEVLKTLKECQIAWPDPAFPERDPTLIHKNKGNCVELMASHLYYINGGKDLRAQNARVGTWVKVGKNWEKIDPCGMTILVFQDLWGCNKYVEKQNFRVLKTDVALEKYDLSKLAGGPVKHNQIQLCGANREFA